MKIKLIILYANLSDEVWWRLDKEMMWLGNLNRIFTNKNTNINLNEWFKLEHKLWVEQFGPLERADEDLRVNQ